ncbi:MAG: hypothetical protein ETSY1_10575 [Candidatus Entotheonella factor]|uniref:Type 4 fimbrial biogenesis protein PilX N-terminal domain-containing protein n=1 Tax=Entotheonella factor TaxID=1429438 RepID=W4LRJ8_ENTF1|nr:pilus assembly PilX N-terminal domain-containing protein [Candidatus Entotheonella palauensis]ETX00613.1 MAG: hypothetical protein ETSY1_10575 [Candidatus Entotheonella factor]
MINAARTWFRSYHRTPPMMGAALINALLVMAMMTGLGVTAMTVSTFDSEITANDRSATQAFYVAEGGVHHAIAILRSPGGADNTFGDELTVNSGVMLDNMALGNGTYTVIAIDNDDGDGDMTLDSDNRIYLRSTGRQSGAESTIQVTVMASGGSSGGLSGVLTEDDLDMPGDAQILGGCGTVHSNGHVDVAGTPTIAETLTASGGITNPVNATILSGIAPDAGAPTQTVPYFNPVDYASYASYQLRSDGNVYDASGALIANANVSPWHGWIYDASGGDNGAGKWDLSSDSTIDGMLYLEGDVTVSSNDPSWETTLVATGAIELSGNFDMTNFQNPTHPVGVQNLLLVAGLDLKINGNPGQTWSEGIMAAGEQLGVSGNPSLNGALIASGQSNLSPTVVKNEISGMLRLDCHAPVVSGTGGGSGVLITAWQDRRN